MAWYTRFIQFFQRKPVAPVLVRAMPKGRTSVDDVNSFSPNTWLVAAPANYEQNWQLLNLSSKGFDQIAPERLLEMMAQLSPEVSRAFDDFRVMCNSGYEFKATLLGSDVEDQRARQAAQAFIDKMDAKPIGGFHDVIDMHLAGFFIYGAMCSELILDKRGRMPLDIATPKPTSIRFRKRSDPERGEVWQPGQWQGGIFVPLDIPTFFYRSAGRMFDTPDGIPMAAPALFTSLFLLGMMHDLRRVIQQQGYPRIDVSIDIAGILESAPQLAANTDQFNNWANSLVTQVENAYSQLQPDDAYIHTSNVIVNRPVGAVDASSLGGVDAIIKSLERMAVRALKTNGLLMELGESTSESEANRKWELYVARIKIVQHKLEDVLGRIFGLALEAQGIQAKVQFTFAELRAAEMLRDAQTETMQIANEKAKYEAGWQTQDEASIAITGTPAVSQTPLQQQPQADIVQDDGDGNEQLNLQNNAVWLTELRQGRAIVADALDVIQMNGYHARS